MRSRWSITAAAVVVASLALAPAAQARRGVSVSPSVGDFETTFVLTGTGWQRSRSVRVEYFDVDLNRSPFKTFSTRSDRNGRVSFRLSKPEVGVETSRTQRLCFVQSGQRRCGRFYVAAPSARVEPSDVKLGGNILLLVSGWPAGFRLQADLLRPGGTTLVSFLTTRSIAPGFLFAGAPFNNVFLPKGGAFLNFLADPSAPVGLYTFYVHPPGQTVGSRTAFFAVP